MKKTIFTGLVIGAVLLSGCSQIESENKITENQKSFTTVEPNNETPNIAQDENSLLNTPQSKEAKILCNKNGGEYTDYYVCKFPNGKICDTEMGYNNCVETKGNETFTEVTTSQDRQEEDPEISKKSVSYKMYNGAYPLTFSYPSHLELSEGDADFFSTIRIWDSTGNEYDAEFSFFITSDESSTEKDTHNTNQKNIQIDDISGIQINEESSPNASIATRQTTKVIVKVDNQSYTIVNWKAGENDDIFQRILESIHFSKE